MAFESPDMGVPAKEVVATALGNGRDRAAGLLTPMVGEWRVRVHLGAPGAAQTATFALPIKTQPVAPPPNQAPVIDMQTVALGLIEIVVVGSSLTFASWLSAKVSSMRLAPARRRTAR